jgi:peptidoglycan/LPS O-acetylase OafA/YrhL
MVYAMYVVSMYYQALLVTMLNAEQVIKNGILSVGIYITLFYVVFLAISLNKWSPKNSKAVTILGGLTYPVYLLHQEIGAILFGVQKNLYSGNVALFVTLFFIISLAYILYRYPERPLQNILKESLIKLLGSK